MCHNIYQSKRILAYFFLLLDGTWATVSCWAPESGIPYTESVAALNNISEADTETAVEQFWKNEVLHASGGIEEIGEVQWDLFICLVVAWALVYGFIWKGLHNSGKVRSVT